ncbi:MAG: hypothetical protein E4H44_02955 [Candidatus Aminicenantes bacterium]|nr:MAG: hypothetical protein E4H44_02955 [Candidatus Aminicenantes bacterium]
MGSLVNVNNKIEYFHRFLFLLRWCRGALWWGNTRADPVARVERLEIAIDCAKSTRISIDFDREISRSVIEADRGGRVGMCVVFYFLETRDFLNASERLLALDPATVRFALE